MPLVRKLVAAGEKVIVFRNARGPAAGCAEYLARDLGLAPARKTIDALPATDLSRHVPTTAAVARRRGRFP
ncbi:hypothetical protein ACU4GD_20005 [Cupriavidus basilensis]